MKNQELIISQSDPSLIRIEESLVRKVTSNEILVRIERFGFTSNNITYVALGKKFQYFDFFPALNSKEAKPPVWGVATVIQSQNPSVAIGERIYGYFPIAKYYHMTPSGIRASHFYVSRPHLPADRAVYNQYFRSKNDPDFASEQEDHMMIFRPLWGTSFFLEDFLQFENYYGAKSIVVSSSSSKTAYCFALLLKGKGKNVIGLTSSQNLDFVKGLDLYSNVYAYDQLDNLPNDNFLYVDFAGNPDLDNNLFSKFGSNIVKRVSVGMSHFDTESQSATFGSMVRENSVNFFAPDWIKRRLESGKIDIVHKRIKAWKELLLFAKKSVHLDYINGRLESSEFTCRYSKETPSQTQGPYSMLAIKSQRIIWQKISHAVV
jgi:hypothetical protein